MPSSHSRWTTGGPLSRTRRLANRSMPSGWINAAGRRPVLNAVGWRPFGGTARCGATVPPERAGRDPAWHDDHPEPACLWAAHPERHRPPQGVRLRYAALAPAGQDVAPPAGSSPARAGIDPTCSEAAFSPARAGIAPVSRMASAAARPSASAGKRSGSDDFGSAASTTGRGTGPTAASTLAITSQ